MYRFCLQFGTASEDEIRAGEFLESLGRKKSTVIIQALIEYLDNHPEYANGNEQRSIQISTVSVDVLEDKIRSLIEERLSGIDLTAISGSNYSAQTKEVSQDIVDMLGDLDLFNM